MAADAEIKTAVESIVNLRTGERAEGVRVKWRQSGLRRWSTFLLWPDDGQTTDDLLALAPEAVRRIMAGPSVDLADDDFAVGA